MGERALVFLTLYLKRLVVVGFLGKQTKMNKKTKKTKVRCKRMKQEGASLKQAIAKHKTHATSTLAKNRTTNESSRHSAEELQLSQSPFYKKPTSKVTIRTGSSMSHFLLCVNNGLIKCKSYSQIYPVPCVLIH